MIHHDKHHGAYVNALNALAKQTPELGTKPVEQTLTDPSYIPLTIQPAVKNNLGGHYNHTFFWELMTPGGAKEPGGELKAAIEGSWKDVNDLKEKINAAGAGRFGSGWAWLVVNKDKKLEITSTANQDTPVALGAKAILGVDVWEHAYYLKYQNRRADYLKAWWNTVNWDNAAANFKTAMAYRRRNRTPARGGVAQRAEGSDDTFRPTLRGTPSDGSITGPRAIVLFCV
jgi:Fe-Mn family superoxide dismutase